MDIQWWLALLWSHVSHLSQIWEQGIIRRCPSRKYILSHGVLVVERWHHCDVVADRIVLKVLCVLLYLEVHLWNRSSDRDELELIIWYRLHGNHVVFMSIYIEPLHVPFRIFDRGMGLSKRPSYEQGC